MNHEIQRLSPMTEEYPTRAGGVIVNDKGEVALVMQKRGAWSFPKGGVEPGEDFLEAARREIYEETGLKDVTFVKELGSYQRTKNFSEEQSELTTLVLFLFRTKNTPVKPIDPDNPEAKWVPKEEVANTLTHPRDQEFFLSILGEL